LETLKLDLDISDFNKVSSIVSNRCGAVFGILNLNFCGCTVCSTGRGYHIYLIVSGEHDSFDVCFLQMALGSDYKREVHNFKRFKKSLTKEWNVLFSKKYDKNGQLTSCEQEEKELSIALSKSIQERIE